MCVVTMCYYEQCYIHNYNFACIINYNNGQSQAEEFKKTFAQQWDEIKLINALFKCSTLSELKRLKG